MATRSEKRNVEKVSKNSKHRLGRIEAKSETGSGTVPSGRCFFEARQFLWPAPLLIAQRGADGFWEKSLGRTGPLAFGSLGNRKTQRFFFFPQFLVDLFH